MSVSIVDLINLRTGESVDGVQFLEQERRLLVQAREKLSRVYQLTPDNLWLACAYCGSPVLLVCGRFDQKFFFRHYPEAERSPEHQCIYKTKGKFTTEQINAMKYNGAKESLPHRELKERLKLSLLSDPNVSDIAIEQVQKSKTLKAWRKPDVSATYQNDAMIFEAQLSTTFLSVIVGRKIFYEAQNAFLVWVFNQFKPTASLIRQSVQDIYFNNNSNAFVVDSETVEDSKKNKEFTMDCHYIFPSLNTETLSISNVWQHKRVRLSELTFNQQTKQIYFFDYEKARIEIDKKIVHIHAEREQKKLAEQQRRKQAYLEQEQAKKELIAAQQPKTLVYSRGTKQNESMAILMPQSSMLNEDQLNVNMRLKQEEDRLLKIEEALQSTRELSELIEDRSLRQIFCDDRLQVFFFDERQKFEKIWIDSAHMSNAAFLDQWLLIRAKIKIFGIHAPEHIFHTPYRTMINCMLSARHARPVGAKNTKLISVAHTLVDHCPQFLLHFRLTLKHCNTKYVLDGQDDGKWAAKVAKYKKESDKTDRSLDAFIEFLIPEFRGRLVSMAIK